MWLVADNLGMPSSGGCTTGRTFHNHGPFVERAWTELQCDAAALSWLWTNRRAGAASPKAEWERLRSQVEVLSRGRFVQEGLSTDRGALPPQRIQDLRTPVVTRSSGLPRRMTRS